MRDRFRFLVSRVKYAALVGATVGEKRFSVESLVEDVRERDIDTSALGDRE